MGVETARTRENPASNLVPMSTCRLLFSTTRRLSSCNKSSPSLTSNGASTVYMLVSESLELRLPPSGRAGEWVVELVAVEVITEDGRVQC